MPELNAEEAIREYHNTPMPIGSWWKRPTDFMGRYTCATCGRQFSGPRCPYCSKMSELIRHNKYQHQLNRKAI